jgi:hypothetical protein
VRRFLTGVGAPVQVRGPARIGSSQSPAANDPAVAEHSQPAVDSTGNNGAVYIGGTWYAINGWLTWALGTLGDSVPHARDYAFSELQRNTLAAHAVAYPAHWDGITSVDDVCRSFYSTDPAICGASLTRSYEGQIIHQPAWSLFDSIRLAGINPTASGFQIKPELPLSSFSLRLPGIGVAYQRNLARGYVVSAASGALTMEVTPPSGGSWRAYADGRRVRGSRRGGAVVFRLAVRAGRAADWAIARG